MEQEAGTEGHPSPTPPPDTPPHHTLYENVDHSQDENLLTEDDVGDVVLDTRTRYIQI